MIFITGDTHCDFKRIEYIQSKTRATAEDYILIAGDFGFVFYDEEETTESFMKRLHEITPATILFVDGNHENFNALAKFPVIDFMNGKAAKISEYCYWLKRGQIYYIDGHCIFTFGGAASIDRKLRTEDWDWWHQEMPTENELKKGREKLLDNLNEIDYIITHDAPDLIYYRHKSCGIRESERQQKEFSHWFNAIKDCPLFKGWFFGHYHEDYIYGKKLKGIYTQIIGI